MYRVLWIEDGATFEASAFPGPVFNSRRYDLVIALDISDAIRQLLQNEFDVVIVDIRMDPGDMNEWKDLYQKAPKDSKSARLGRSLLYSLFCPQEALIKLEKIPAWITPDRFGILTVESERELEKDLIKWGIKYFVQKSAKVSASALLAFIDKMIQDRTSTEQAGA
ncbi:MAG: hypothetical protein NT002_13660 [candidate division Zixibacteria bacterium]|nr:hypothetical protein [candidate division Zixibacteria bacterium]